MAGILLFIAVAIFFYFSMHYFRFIAFLSRDLAAALVFLFFLVCGGGVYIFFWFWDWGWRWFLPAIHRRGTGLIILGGGLGWGWGWRGGYLLFSKILSSGPGWDRQNGRMGCWQEATCFLRLLFYYYFLTLLDRYPSVYSLFSRLERAFVRFFIFIPSFVLEHGINSTAPFGINGMGSRLWERIAILGRYIIDNFRRISG